MGRNVRVIQDITPTANSNCCEQARETHNAIRVTGILVVRHFLRILNGGGKPVLPAAGV